MSLLIPGTIATFSAMRLLTHNVLRNNTAAVSKGSSAPLRITATEVRVDDAITSDDDEERQVNFVTGMLPVLNWETLVQGAKAMGLYTLPPAVTPELAQDKTFLRALYHVLMDVHLINGMLTCGETGREFPVTNGVVDMMMEESECE